MIERILRKSDKGNSKLELNKLQSEWTIEKILLSTYLFLYLQRFVERALNVQNKVNKGVLSTTTTLSVHFRLDFCYYAVQNLESTFSLTTIKDHSRISVWLEVASSSSNWTNLWPILTPIDFWKTKLIHYIFIFLILSVNAYSTTNKCGKKFQENDIINKQIKVIFLWLPPVTVRTVKSLYGSQS